MERCSVCGSANLNEFDCDAVGGHYPAWWCEDCGSMHVGPTPGDPDKTQTWLPEKSMLHHQVLAFHKRFGQSIGEKPHILDEKTLRFRLSLVAEEFFEMLDAAGYCIYAPERGSVSGEELQPYTHAPPVDFPALVDALADLDYVIEGFRITMGVNGTPIADEVQRANMSKLPGYVAAKDASHGKEPSVEEFARRQVGSTTVVGFDVEVVPTGDEDGIVVKRADGKIMKPPGWTPPDIEGELKLQGWEP